MRRHRRTEAAAADAPWQPRRRPALLAAVLLGHGLLLLGWRLALAPHATPPAATGPAAPPLVWLSLAAAPAPVAPRPTTEPAPNPRAAPRASRPISPDLPAPTTDLTVIPPTASPAEPLPPGIAMTAAPEPPASSASAPRGRLLDSAATREAVRQIGRQPLLSERAADATGLTPVSAAQRMADAASAAAKGDCVKGDYAGGGMGLLSLPFLAVAVARGQCAR